MKVRREGIYTVGDDGLRVQDAAWSDDDLQRSAAHCRVQEAEARTRADDYSRLADFYEAVLASRESAPGAVEGGDGG